jgi:hypothetical protein
MNTAAVPEGTGPPEYQDNSSFSSDAGKVDRNIAHPQRGSRIET